MTARKSIPPPTDPEQDVGLALMRTALLLRQTLQRQLAAERANVGPAETAVLHCLALGDGRRVGELADATHHDRTALTRVADRLVKKRLVTRREDPEDRRAVRLRLTAAGRRLHARLLPLRTEILGRAVAPLTDRQRRELLEALSIIRTQLLSQIEEK